MFIVQEENEKTQADIRIIGVGGAGNNMIETMIKDGIKGVDFIAINTDHQALESSSAKRKIQIGSKLTKGLGAGANPEVGRRASVESYEEIVNCLKGADMIFVTAGMGGGTGTGAAPFIAQSAHELGILTVGIVTKPFLFEGHKRIKQAKRGISELSQYVDTLIVVPNEKLLGLTEKNTPLLETFKLTDEVLLQAVKGISELVSVPGLINLDFADIKTVMRDKGMALMGRGCASGPNRVDKALKLAISSPILEGLSIKGATGIIVNVTADSSLSLLEFQKASSYITELADPSADIIVGTVIDENMKDQLSVTVIATGFNDEIDHTKLTNEKSKELLTPAQPSSLNPPSLNNPTKSSLKDNTDNSFNENSHTKTKELTPAQPSSLNPPSLNPIAESSLKDNTDNSFNENSHTKTKELTPAQPSSLHTPSLNPIAESSLKDNTDNSFNENSHTKTKELTPAQPSSLTPPSLNPIAESSLKDNTDNSFNENSHTKTKELIPAQPSSLHTPSLNPIAESSLEDNTDNSFNENSHTKTKELTPAQPSSLNPPSLNPIAESSLKDNTDNSFNENSHTKTKELIPAQPSSLHTPSLNPIAESSLEDNTDNSFNENSHTKTKELTPSQKIQNPNNQVTSESVIKTISHQNSDKDLSFDSSLANNSSIIKNSPETLKPDDSNTSSSEANLSKDNSREVNASVNQFSENQKEASENSTKKKKPTLKEILLSKSEEYQKYQDDQNISYSEKQINMNLKENHEELSSPFEAEVDFSDHDLS